MCNTKSSTGCSWDISPYQNQKWVTHKNTIFFFLWRAKKLKFLVSDLLLNRVTLLDRRMYCIKHPLEFIWNSAERYEWHPVFLAGWRSNFCNSDKGSSICMWKVISGCWWSHPLPHCQVKNLKWIPSLAWNHGMMGCSGNLFISYGFIRLVYNSGLT